MRALNDALYDRQREIEEEMSLLGSERYRKQYDRALEKDRFDDTYPGTILIKMAIEKLADAISQWKNEALGGGVGRRNRAALNIAEMNPKEVAYVAIRTILSRLYRMDTLTYAATRVGKAVMDEARFQEFSRAKPYLYAKVDETEKRQQSSPERRAKVMIYSMNKFDVEFKVWTDNEKLQLGLKLIELFEQVTGYVEIVKVPAATRGHQHRLYPSEKTMGWIEDRNSLGATIRPVWLPTVLPPKEWESIEGGPYHFGIVDTSNVHFIKRKADNRVKFSDGEADMGLVFQGVNAIQNTAWAINKDILSVVQMLWNGNHDVPGLPSKENKKVPAYPVDGTEEAIQNWKLTARRTYEENAKSKGIRLGITMALNMAERYAKDDRFFFPHTVDFRARVYSLIGCLNPQGDDFSRSLLTFADGKPLGDYDAVRWLAIHGANVYGEDKLKLDERMQWVYDHEDEILWCAEDPLKFDWWKQADKPFSFLAFCYEWAGYKREGLHFVSRLPIALDGTCNGLQHFSAMLRDPVGGASVNLLPSETPQDIYKAVADWVMADLRRDHGDEKQNSWAEQFLAIGIDRNITKRPVMVLPYGGTYLSCLDYVGEAMREKLGNDNPFGDDLAKALGFLASRVWEGMFAEIKAARDAMGFLQQCTAVLSKHGKQVEWTSPSGFRVKQKYVSMTLRRVRTMLYGETTYLSFQHQTDDIDKRKQRGAVAPNFVHSLDAAAMMITIDLALDEGINNFAMIHDSYGTLAADTQRFSQLIREAFVRMYEQHDVLEDFRQDVLEALPEAAHKEVPPVPAKGNLVIGDVRRSDFFFS